MLKICLVFWKSEPQYAYKRYAYKKTCIAMNPSWANLIFLLNFRVPIYRLLYEKLSYDKSIIHWTDSSHGPGNCIPRKSRFFDIFCGFFSLAFQIDPFLFKKIFSSCGFQ